MLWYLNAVFPGSDACSEASRKFKLRAGRVLENHLELRLQANKEGRQCRRDSSGVI